MAITFAGGDAVIYTASDPLRSPNIDEYRATVVMARRSPKGDKVQIDYVRDGRKVRSWVSVKRLRAVKSG